MQLKLINKSYFKSLLYFAISQTFFRRIFHRCFFECVYSVIEIFGVSTCILYKMFLVLSLYRYDYIFAK